MSTDFINFLGWKNAKWKRILQAILNKPEVIRRQQLREDPAGDTDGEDCDEGDYEEEVDEAQEEAYEEEEEDADAE